MKNRKMIFFSLILLSLTIIFCDDTQNATTKPVDPPEIEEPPGPDPEEPIIMKAAFIYDGSIKGFNDDDSLTNIIDASTLVRINDKFIVDNKVKETIDGETLYELPGNVLKACFYGEKLWIYTSDNKLYMVNSESDFQLLYTNTNNYTVALNDDGICIGFTFFNPDGSIIIANSSIGFWPYNKIVAIRKIGDNRLKDIFNGVDTWTEVASSLYTSFYKYDALITENKIIWPMGATLDLQTMEAIEPTYNIGLQDYEGGNAFTRYFIKYTDQRWQPVGYKDDVAYFFYPKEGRIYKYSITGDSLTQWIEIVPGTEEDSIVLNNELIEKTNAILIEDEIIYFDGSKIQRVNVETGVKNEIAEATEFKGIIL